MAMPEPITPEAEVVQDKRAWEQRKEAARRSGAYQTLQARRGQSGMSIEQLLSIQKDME
jgi:hypothetical protein